MNNRERILKMLSGQQPDRVPWFGDLAYWAHALELQEIVPQNWQLSEDYYRFHRELNVGFYLQGYFCFRETTSSDVQIENTIEPDRRIRSITTPVGELLEVWQLSSESYSEAPVKWLIESVDDLAVLRYWMSHTSYAPDPAEALRRRPMVADQGVVLCYLPRSPFMELTAVLSGMQNLVNLWMDHRDEFEATLDTMADAFDRASEAALTVPADCFMIPENLSSEVVGKRFYAKYVHPWETKWVDRIHRLGKTAFIHMDGTLGGLISEVSETGFDVIEACTPLPVGDLDIADLRRLVRPSTIIWGGIPGSYFTPIVSDAEFDRHIRHVLDVMTADGHMVLGIADQAPPDTLRSRVAHVIDLVEAYGSYSA